MSDNNTVVYSPTSQAVYGALPVTETYPLSITCPTAVTTFPLTVTLVTTVNSVPVGDFATALTYVTYSNTTITFNSPGETQTVNVTVTLPQWALTPSVPAGAYTYTINTAGWPSNIVDSNSQINAQVQVGVPPSGHPPVVAINNPSNFASYSYQSATFPQTINFDFTATTDSTSPLISTIGASFGTPTSMTPVSVTPVGLGTATVNGTGTITFPGPGTYQLSATATNSIGTAMDEHTITVNVSVPPPTVVITSPSQNPQVLYQYRYGDPALVVPFTFVGSTTFGGIADLTASVDGVAQNFTIDGLNTLSATATVNLIYDTEQAAGVHTLSVTTTDVYGQTATTTGSFSINYIGPTPHVVIQTPSSGQRFPVPLGQSTTNVPYQFATTVTNGFNVDTVSASLNGSPLSPVTTGIGSPTATSTGTMNLAPGTYELTAIGGTNTAVDTQKVTFTVYASGIPPTVAINSPADGYVTQILPGASASIPFQFTGTSHTPGAVITGMTATLDGNPLTFACTTYGQPVAVGTATLTLSATKTYKLVVTATDAFGTATATSAFTLALVPAHAVSGSVFFDTDANGADNAYDYGLAGVTLTLRDSTGTVLATTTSDAAGQYSFPGLYPGGYTVAATPSAGLKATTPTQVSAAMAQPADVSAAPIGFTLDMTALRSMSAGGYTIGYWKNNIDKAMAGTTGGVQVSAADIQAYTNALAYFALNPFDGLTQSQASAIMGATSSLPADLLAKQLLASEYNYENHAYLNGNGLLTYAFVTWGEAVLANSSTFSDAYIIWAKDWFDAYNNTHGGTVRGPGPFTGTMYRTTSTSSSTTTTTTVASPKKLHGKG